MTTGKTIALTRWNFAGKVMSLLFNMLSRLVRTFLPRSKHLLISWLQPPSAVILEPQKIVCHCFHCFPVYFPDMVKHFLASHLPSVPQTAFASLILPGELAGPGGQGQCVFCSCSFLQSQFSAWYVAGAQQLF